MTRIIGIDPGSIATGYGVIDVSGNQITHVDCGGIIPSQKDPVEKKLQFIYENIKNRIEEFKPDAASVEDLFFAKNPKSAFILGQVRGVILLALAETGIPYGSYPPREVKKAITGYGNADKAQIQYMVRNMLRLSEDAMEDASDALAIAICHSSSIKMQNRLIK